MSATIAPAPGHQPAAAGSSNEEITQELRDLLGPKKVLSRLIELTAKAGDASIYRLTPRVVVQPDDIDDVKLILDYCTRRGLYLTFRAAGTSLSGQAVTDGVLVEIAHGWKGMRFLDDAHLVAVEPGVIASNVNAFLAPYHAKIGPDPASINACMMGGVAANNASGMCCGVEFNSYHTLSSLRVVLPDGYVLDTALADCNERLEADRPELVKGLREIRSAIVSDSELADRIRRKFSIKNTCGYSMNAFVDFEKPADILSHLVIGSEGTLAFLAEITLKTLPDMPFKATALVYFVDLVDAGKAIAPLEQAGAAVLEIMDRASMLSVAEEMNYPFDIGVANEPNAVSGSGARVEIGSGGREIVTSNCAALLIEFQEVSEPDLQNRLAEAQRVLSEYRLLTPVNFTRDEKVRGDYWHMRKGLFPSVGAMREIGTAVIIEDLCVEPHNLADAIEQLQLLFKKHNFPDAITFGHAKNGNLHFVICTDFADPIQVQRYAALMDELTHMIVARYDGSLKAEHGTGRNIAPFVEREWGEKLTELMWDVKHLLDPHGILSPGVVLTRDPQAHLKNLKVMPAVSPVVDKCIECGFCEPRCPSRDLTTTPRQRIVLLREVERLRALGDSTSLSYADALMEEYEYYGKETCAVDGMCSTSCPVKINTGEMIKDLRHGSHSEGTKKAASLVVKNFAVLTRAARGALGFMAIGGAPAVAVARAGAAVMNKISGGTFPRLPVGIPIPGPAPVLRIRKGPSRPDQNGSQSAEDAQARINSRTVVYYPTCLTRSMGKIAGEKTQVGTAEAVVAILEKCGFPVVVPEKISSSCCGQPFFSKGFFEAGAEAVGRTVQMLWEISRGGELPIVCDTSPCSGQFMHCDKYLSGADLEKWKALKIYDLPNFIALKVIPERTDWPKVDRQVVLHTTCTTMKEGWTPHLKLVAETFVQQVDIPILTECCGFAGDRGFLFPELTLSATREESLEVRGRTGIDPAPQGDPLHDVVRARGEMCTPINTNAEADALALNTPGANDKLLCEGNVGCYSSCRTCEIGMTAGTGQVYSGIVHLVYEALIGPGKMD